MVVAPLSQSESFQCWQCHGRTETLPTCSQCGVVQEIVEGTSHYDLLRLPLALSYDSDLLRNRYYELAKLVHPDRFMTKSPQEATLAAKWTQRLNKAYQTLKTRRTGAQYLLQLLGYEMPAKPPIPMDLAEEYFGLQDLLSGGSNDGMTEFLTKLNSLRVGMEEEWKAVSQAWDDEPKASNTKTLSKIAELLVKEKYFDSMLADIERKQGH